MSNVIKLGIGYEIINSYKRLSYKQWFALAEYIDNSTQALINNPALVEIFKQSQEILYVDIAYTSSGGNEKISIKDNSIGMSLDELQKAITLGSPPTNISGRSRYGLGMKTASFWLGNEWSVTTKKLGETEEHTVSINLKQTVANDGELSYSKKDKPADTHYTNITITDLNQPFSSRTRGKVKEYLRSIYRKDIFNKTLKLIWQGEELTWDYQAVLGDFVKMADDEDRVTLDFSVGKKRVTGWAAVLVSGSRARAGFSVFHNDRVIKGWPDAYKPETIFGSSGGRNDLINQRVVGELFMSEFTVSHTKDDIIFEGDEEDTLEFLLKEKLIGVITLANQYYRKSNSTALIKEASSAVEKAINTLGIEFSSPELRDAFDTFEIPDEDVIEENNRILISNVASRSAPALIVNLGSLYIRVFLDSDISRNDPYLSLGVHSVENKLDVLINKSHPHWNELHDSDTILNYIRHCVYDGASEWKAAKFNSEIKPDTVKTIKDNLLRVIYTIKTE